MLNENLKKARIQKGLSQEELAIRLHVVRQTISKWEKGLSVPDATMLIKIAEILDVTVAILLGATVIDETDNSEIASQLVRINEQLAIKNNRTKKILKIIMVIVIGFLVLNIVYIIIGAISSTNYQTKTRVETEEIVEN